MKLTSQSGLVDFAGGRAVGNVFTEHCVATFSSVLRSPKAVQVNIGIVRAFVRLREMIATDREMAGSSSMTGGTPSCSTRCGKLLAPPDAPKKHPIGSIHPKD